MNTTYDKLIQKYLKGTITQQEKDKLLDFSMRFINRIISISKEVKMGVTIE